MPNYEAKSTSGLGFGLGITHNFSPIIFRVGRIGNAYAAKEIYPNQPQAKLLSKSVLKVAGNETFAPNTDCSIRSPQRYPKQEVEAAIATSLTRQLRLQSHLRRA